MSLLSQFYRVGNGTLRRPRRSSLSRPQRLAWLAGGTVVVWALIGKRELPTAIGGLPGPAFGVMPVRQTTQPG
jgi:hypothetical protein